MRMPANWQNVERPVLARTGFSLRSPKADFAAGLPPQAKASFTAVGACVARELTSRHRWDGKRSDLTANAITLHLNVVVGAEHGKEAQMVRAGSGGDVAGLGLDVLARDQVRQIVDRFPRHRLKTKIIDMLMTEVSARPCCRTAFLCQSLGFTELTRRNRVFSE